MKNMAAALAGMALFGTSLPARAEVVDSSPSGFTVKEAYSIQSTPQEVYRRLVHNVGDWWSPRHTFSGDSRNLTIDDRPMGCYCEKLPHGGGVRHMEVIYAAPGERLRMSGALGPLQSIAAVGVMDIQIASGKDGGADLTVVYTVGGYLPRGLNNFAAAVDHVVHEQFDRLKAYVEHGEAGLPEPK